MHSARLWFEEGEGGREGRRGEVDSERKGRREAFAEPEPEEQTEKENNLYFPPAFCLQPVRAVELTGG